MIPTHPLCLGLLALATIAPPAPVRAAPPPLAVSQDAIAEIIPLALDAIAVTARATARQRRYENELRARGIANLPGETTSYSIDMAGLGKLIFNDRGELSLDTRFLSADDLKTVKKIENWIAKWFPRETARRKQPRRSAGSAGLPVFRGFESDRYQIHDTLIARLVAEFNADKRSWCDGTAKQAAAIPALSPALVKSQMIEESGGNGLRSRAAWAVDPLQVNVPGDWGDEKELVGLKKPQKRNEGTLEDNVRAGIKYLVRKGFSTSAKPARTRPSGTFDGWKTAVRRYNGRRDRTETDRYYSDEYADKIMRRAENPDLFEPIQIKLAK